MNLAWVATAVSLYNSVAAVQHIALATATELVIAIAARQTVDPPAATTTIISVASDQDAIAPARINRLIASTRCHNVSAAVGAHVINLKPRDLRKLPINHRTIQTFDNYGKVGGQSLSPDQRVGIIAARQGDSRQIDMGHPVSPNFWLGAIPTDRPSCKGRQRKIRARGVPLRGSWIVS